MAVIYGSKANSPGSLNIMHDKLVHRAGLPPVHLGNAHWQLGSALASWDTHQARGSGSAQQDDLMVVVAGEPLHPTTLQVLLPEDVLMLFQKKGIQALTELHGAFVMAIAKGPKLHLLRDAAGLRTLYYTQNAGDFYFAVETKALLALPGVHAKLSLPSLFQYYTYSFVPLGQTMLEHLLELPAGQYVSCDAANGQLSLTDYFPLFDIPKAPQQDLTYWSDRIRAELSADIAQKLQGHEEVGVFLSGGLDSSIITALVAQQHKRRIHTFSINFGDKYPNENAFAKLVADRYGTIHHEVTILPKDFSKRFSAIMYALDEPSGDPITAPNFELARFARNHVGCIFNGEGGDPCFGGPKNIPMLLHHWYSDDATAQPSRARAYLASYKRGYEHLKKLLHPDILKQLDESRDLEALLLPFFEAPKLGLLDKLMCINIKVKGAHLILPKVERMLGAHGFVPFSPLFSRAMVTSSMAMPAQFKLNNGIEKYILKRAFENDLPSAIIQRPKSGMRVPVRYWFQGELKRHARRMLNDKAVREAGLYNPQTVKELLRYDSNSGLDRHGLLLWMMITLETWRSEMGVSAN